MIQAEAVRTQAQSKLEAENAQSYRAIFETQEASPFTARITTLLAGVLIWLGLMNMTSSSAAAPLGGPAPDQDGRSPADEGLYNSSDPTPVARSEGESSSPGISQGTSPLAALGRLHFAQEGDEPIAGSSGSAGQQANVGSSSPSEGAAFARNAPSPTSDVGGAGASAGAGGEGGGGRSPKPEPTDPDTGDGNTDTDPVDPPPTDNPQQPPVDFDDRVQYGGQGDDQLTGTELTDVLYGRARNDVLFGHGGDDFLFGEEGDDVLFGGAGADVLRPGPGKDIVLGGDGNDTIFSDSGEIVVRAGAGNDRLLVMPGLSFGVAEGGEGLDTIDFSRLSGGVSFNSNGDQAQWGQGATLAFSSFEKIVGTQANDWFVLGETATLFTGKDGSDVYFLADGSSGEARTLIAQITDFNVGDEVRLGSDQSVLNYEEIRQFWDDGGRRTGSVEQWIEGAEGAPAQSIQLSWEVAQETSTQDSSPEFRLRIELMRDDEASFLAPQPALQDMQQ
jgi:hypothetical protein